MNVSGMELGGLFQEPEAGVGIHHILDEWHKFLGRDHVPIFARFAGENVHELSSLVVMRGAKFAPKVRKGHIRQKAGLVPTHSRKENALPIQGVATSLQCKVIEIGLKWIKLNPKMHL